MNETKKVQEDKRTEILNYMQFPKLDFFFAKHLNLIFYLSLLMLLLFGILLFDVRVSYGGDDSDYLLEAMKFSKGESFPSFHGIMYALLIGMMIKIFGFHLMFLKSLSLIFLLLHQIVFFLTFRRRISPFLLGSVLLIMSVSSGILYYGSQTYTEAFFFLLQGFLLYTLVLFPETENNLRHLKTAWKNYLALGFILFLMVATRNIGLAAIAAVILYFIIRRKFLTALLSVLSYLLFNFPYSLYKKLRWGVEGSDFGSQFSKILLKNPYNASLGQENFGGFVIRLFENSKIYLSRIFLQEAGLRKLDAVNTNLFLTLIIVALFITGLVFALKEKKKIYTLVFLYLLMAMGITLVSLNQIWSQQRLIIIFVPLIILTLSYTLSALGNFPNMAFIRGMVILLLAVSFLANISRTLKNTGENSKIMKAAREGDKYYGFTPDYQHFLKLSEWSAMNLPEDVMIGSRKASMSFIYGNGRYFYPIFKFSYEVTEDVLAQADSSDKVVYFVDDLILEKRDKSIVNELKRDLEAIISFDETVFSMFTVEPSRESHIDSVWQTIHVQPVKTVLAFRESVMPEYGRTSAVLPDKILNRFYKDNVQYLINASLRINREIKSDEAINTITRYLIAISSKYPGSLKMVKQIGSNRDEPARLFRIDYKNCEKLGWVPGGQ